MKKNILFTFLLIILIFSNKSFANLDKSYDYFSKNFPLAAISLFLFSLERGKIESAQVPKMIKTSIEKVGFYPFVEIKEQNLKLIKTEESEFILAYQDFLRKKYEDSLKKLSSLKLSENKKLLHKKYLMMGYISALNKNFKDADLYYSLCEQEAIEESQKQECYLNKARNFYALQEYKKGLEFYSEIKINQITWPKSLLDEAWFYYSMGDYNRSIGKLITYRAPILSEYKNVESLYLETLSYLRLCHFDEAERVKTNFIQFYEKEYQDILNSSKTKDPQYFYTLFKQIKEGHTFDNKILEEIALNLSKTFQYNSLFDLLKEISDEKSKAVSQNIKAAPGLLDFLHAKVESFLKRQIYNYFIKSLNHVGKIFKNFSLIGLEVIRAQKSALISGIEGPVKGDMRNLNIESYHLFWDFIHEFWLTELGSYIPALENKCVKS